MCWWFAGLGWIRLSAAWRILLWVFVSMAVSTLLYWQQIVSLLDWSLKTVLGRTQIYPAAGMVFTGAFILFRLREIWASLNCEVGFRSKVWVRLVGLLIVFTPLLIYLQQGLYVFKDADISAIVLVVVWFGVFVAINPLTSKGLMPYVILHVVSTIAPRFIYSLAGDFLADFTSVAVGFVAKLLGIPIFQVGRSIEVLSFGSDWVQLTITPDCSSISSVTVFLLLCGLMHLDLRKRFSTTIPMALFGVMSLMVLNVLRIVVLLWVGYVGGERSLWHVHGWLGYAIFIGFYALAARIYVRSR